VRRAALRALADDRDPELAALLPRLLCEDPAWAVRRDAVRLLGRWPPPTRWGLLAALSDPVWRVRRSAVRRLARWRRQDPAVEAGLRAWVAGLAGPGPLVAGALRYLDFLTGPAPEGPLVPPDSPRPAPWQRAPWWDDDPPVLEQRLRHLSEAELRRDLRLLPGLLTLQDGWTVLDCLRRVRRFVLGALQRLAAVEDLLAVVPLLDESRHPYAAAEVAGLLARLPAERREALAREVLADRTGRFGGPSLRWAREGAGANPPDASWQQNTAGTAVAPQGTAPCHGRAGRAWPPQNTAPHGTTPCHGRAGRARPPQNTADTAVAPLPGEQAEAVRLRPLGRTGLLVAPLGLSGRYRLPEAGFAAALRAGVNLFFWEPSYHTQTSFWRRLPAAERERLVVVAGTFAAEPSAVRRDLDEALRQLRLERLGVFLLFWVRSAARWSDEVLGALDDVRQAGLARAVGLSTHQRPLALAALRDGWEVVMVRHSLAHPGAEAEVLPEALARGAGVLTFSALCHGTLLRREAGVPAADAYRYTLSQPGVSACWSAPRTLRQLRANLEALRQPTLPPERLAELRRRGAALHPGHRAFLECIRWR
jgi:aryl-alcohol dehydrogenase-like predicted oxidoreductase